MCFDLSNDAVLWPNQRFDAENSYFGEFLFQIYDS